MRNMNPSFPSVKQGLLLLCLWILGSSRGVGQPPAIYYGAYKLFTKDSAIQPLAAFNAGGPVPANTYTATTTLGATNPLLRWKSPAAIAIAGNGNIYVADDKENSITLITPNGQVHTIVGKAAKGKAIFNGPSGIALDKEGWLYVADCYNHQIKKVSPTGTVSLLAGTGKPGHANNSNGLLASFNYPVSLALDTAGNVYVSDEGNRQIRKITPSGSVSTLAGSGTTGSQDHSNGLLASFNQPNGIAVDKQGNVFVADQLNHKIRKVSPSGQVSTFAGTGLAGLANQRNGSSASFNQPRGMAVDAIGNVYVGDVGNHQIRKITANGEVTSFAGSGIAGTTDNEDGLQAAFYFPNGLAVDSKGDVYVADYLNSSIRKVTATGYSIFPNTLPAGIRFNNTTGMFSGRPLQWLPGQEYTVSAYNLQGSSTTTMGIAVSAQPGNALQFDGFDDLVTVPNAPSLNPTTVTVEMWVRPNQDNMGCRYLLKRNSLSRFDDGYAIGMDSSNRFQAVMVSGDGEASGQRFVKQLQPADMGRWYHVAAVFRADSMRLYVNAVFQRAVATGFPLSHGVNALSLGFDKSATFTADEVRVFNTDRSASVAADMLNTLPTDMPGLVAYYNFNMGSPSGQNSAYTNLYDLSPNANHGKLQNFLTLNGNQSNWVESYAMVVPVAQGATHITTTGFTANWLPPHLGMAENYVLDIAEDALFTKLVHSISLIQTNKAVDGLKPNTVYYYRVRANKHSVEGQGAYSSVVHVKTLL